ncbi:MAG: hypothetical protein JWP01_3499 [Myxococcales bacterium]|jgi:hypothetical protein|nr:hypothetical protein [Myxococcales bacterium]
MRPAWLLALLVGCAGADAMTSQQPAPAEAQPANELGLHPGETMAFEVRLAGVLAGEAQLAVGQLGDVDGRKAIVVRSRAATAGAAALIKKISDEATTVIDVETGRPISLDARVENSGKTSTATAKFSGASAEVTYQRSGDKEPRTTKLNFGTVIVFDAHTAMGQLRGWKATRGAVRTVYVIGGRRLWKIDVTYAGEETIGSALGNRRAILFEGKSYRARSNMTVESDKPARTFSVWLSDDADRVPLKVTAKTELGDIVMDLTDYAR